MTPFYTKPSKLVKIKFIQIEATPEFYHSYYEHNIAYKLVSRERTARREISFTLLAKGIYSKEGEEDLLETKGKFDCEDCRDRGCFDVEIDGKEMGYDYCHCELGITAKRKYGQT